MPPPANVLADALVKLMVPVPVMVRFVDVLADQGEVPAIVQVPEPTAIVRAVATDVATVEDALLKVTLKLFASNVPAIKVVVDDEQVKASCNVTNPPGLLKEKP